MSQARFVVVGCLATLALLLAACSSSPSGSKQSQGSTNSGSTGSNSGAGSGAQQSDVARSCEADYRVLEVALAAYNASVGSNATPPAPWSASTYTSNFAPLVSSSAKQGPFMHDALDPTRYVIEYDGQGNVWVEPAGTYDTSYNPPHAASDKACASIVG